jgi:hypothetical protein
MSYDVKDYAKLGILHRLLHVQNPQEPALLDIDIVKQAITDAIKDARRGPSDLGVRLQSPEAQVSRKAGIAARALMQAQWHQA